MNEPKRPASDAEWYCRKYHVSWCSASEKERLFIEEVSRVTYERDRATRLGLPVDSVRPAFAS